MTTLAVTSMSREGWAHYGARCIASYARYWPASIPLVVYADEAFDVSPAECRLTSAMDAWTAQVQRWKRRRAQPPPRGWIKPRSYIWDVARFAIKPYVWADAAIRCGDGIVIWLDADTETIAPVPDDLPATILGTATVAYLGRRAMHPETGFVAFRVREALPLLRWCVKVYRQNKFLVWQDGWTDCHVLRRGLRDLRVKTRDLTSHRQKTWHSGVDAMALSPLGPYVVHHKGRRHAPKAVQEVA